MKIKEKTKIKVEVTINAPIEKVWEMWTQPFHIMHWNRASEDWHCPKANNDLREGGRFMSRMEARNGSGGFDFEGTYDVIKKYELIAYTMDDGRKVRITFTDLGNKTMVVESFDPEKENTVEAQEDGWQSILDNFKNYVENKGENEVLHYEKVINAQPEKVYQALIDKHKFTEWTIEFNKTSRFEGTWNKGDTIKFIGTDEEGNSGGMIGRIKENIPNEFISIEYTGLIENGKEIKSGPEVEELTGALENYTFQKAGNKTELIVNADSSEKYLEFLRQAWPRALDRLKRICEE